MKKSNKQLKEDKKNNNIKKIAESNTYILKSNNNIANMTEKVNDETNK